MVSTSPDSSTNGCTFLGASDFTDGFSSGTPGGFFDKGSNGRFSVGAVREMDQAHFLNEEGQPVNHVDVGTLGRHNTGETDLKRVKLHDEDGDVPRVC